ncbi:MAG: Phosphoserine phosphatase 1 [Phycisphaerae bacterium]|nr:Phosphoserine phosphatase 1 [Phycisphaerae bacterium]
MMTIYLIQSGQTDYQGEGRLQGRLSMPLSAVGQEQSESARRQMAEVELTAIYAPDDEASTATAKAVAKGRRMKVRVAKGLSELDLGLWQGSTPAQIEHRQPRVYRRWLEEPAAVTPPEGESFEAAYGRVAEAVDAILARHHEPSGAVNVAVVAPPMAAALVRCYLGRGEISQVWSMVQASPDGPQRFEVEPVDQR